MDFEIVKHYLVNYISFAQEPHPKYQVVHIDLIICDDGIRLSLVELTQLGLE